MGINQNTIYAWKKRDEWDETPPVQRVSQSMDARLIQLTDKKDKNGGDFKEIDLLTRQLKKLSDGQPAGAGAGIKPRKRKLKTTSPKNRSSRCGRKYLIPFRGINAAGMSNVTSETA
nr:hypothetical protein SYMBAF_80001 [Serratia symbiotica]